MTTTAGAVSETVYSDRVRNEIMDKGVEPHASEWLMRALHPPADGGPVAIPDESFRPSVKLTFRPVVTITAPAGLADGATWDLCVYTPPSDVTAAVWCAAPAGSDFSSTGGIAGEVLGRLDLQATTGKPVNAYDVDSGINNYQTGLPAADYWSFRTTNRSATMHLIASSIENSGTITAVQVDRDYVRESGFFVDSAGAGPEYVSATALASLPFTEEGMTLLVPGSYTAPAKEGVYIPHRLLGPSQPFCDAAIWRDRFSTVAQADGTAAIKFALANYVSSGGVQNRSCSVVATLPVPCAALDPLTPAAGIRAVGWVTRAYTSTGVPTDIGQDRCASGVTIFRGLNQRASVQLRMYVGLEVIPNVTSPLRTFVEPAAQPSQAAMQLYYRCAAKLGIAFPARYNLFGAMLPAIGALLNKIAPRVLPALGAAARAGFDSFVNRPRPSAAPALVAPPPPAPMPRQRRASSRQPKQRRSSSAVSFASSGKRPKRRR